MNRIIDKSIIILCCMPVLLLVSFTSVYVVAFLMAIVVASLYELIPGNLRVPISCVYVVCALFVPAFIVFLPVVVYDCLRGEQKPVRFLWVIPLIISFSFEPLAVFGYICLLATAACALSVRTSRIERERVEHLALRDGLREMSLSLESKNHELRAAQDYEVRLATLNERSRIAREIHDNVGHLLTRAIMQVEASQVVYATNEPVCDSFAEVGTTLHEAMDTVRSSVHELYDDALDVRMQIEGALAGCGIAQTCLVYDANELPPAVGYCFMAIVREALSNTARHSDATLVKVDIHEHPGLFQLIVQDNGSFKPVITNGGIGLQTMEDRARTLGGVVRVEYRNGFRVFVSIPRKLVGSKRASVDEALGVVGDV
jgi:signal transduction histidine kinase